MTNSRNEKGPQGVIYLVCFAHIQTGGTLAIHQLASTLKGLGHDARIVYFLKQEAVNLEKHPGLAQATSLAAPEIADKMPAAYASFGTTDDRYIADNAEHSIIVPEVIPGLLSFGKKIRKYLWWLSVDNLGDDGRWLTYGRTLREMDIDHLVQSAYAEHYLTTLGVSNIHRLTDYTDPIFFDDTETTKQDIVLFNPKKGLEFVTELIRYAPDITWVAIAGLSPAKVRDLLKCAKVYVDFGNHPGKDRIPREAAISGCCVLTGRKGAAGHFPDVPIPENYKFREGRDAIPAIIELLRDCINNYPSHKPKFDSYRRAIRLERKQFELQAERVFGNIG